METINIIANPMEVTPVMQVANMEFKWNHEELKKYLATRLDKFNGLVVTEDNLEDCKKDLREIVSLRSRLTRFGRDTKRQLKEPADVFAAELNTVLEVVAKVEHPLKAQIDDFERAEMLKRKEKVLSDVKEKIALYGVRDEYKSLIALDPRWWENKTAKWADVREAVEMQVKAAHDKQEADDQLKVIRQEKEGMLKAYIDMFNTQYELSVPITFRDIGSVIMQMNMEEARGFIQDRFEEQLALEMKVAEEQKKRQEEKAAQVQEKPQPVIEEEVPDKVSDYSIKVFGVSDYKKSLIEKHLKECGIEYEIQDLLF